MSPADKRRDRVAEMRELSEVTSSAVALRGQHETASRVPKAKKPRRGEWTRVPGSPVWHCYAAPIVKRAGGKARLLPHILSHLPERCDRYVEPFLGGGAVLFAYGPNAEARYVADADPHLMRMYEQVVNRPSVVHAGLAAWAQHDSSEQYYQIRNMYNGTWSTGQPAQAYLYLNHACYSGLWRVTKGTGHFNVPWGKRPKVHVPSLATMQAVADLLQRSTLVCQDFAKTFDQVVARDVVYVDPPYPGTFDMYTRDGFPDVAHHQLAEHCASAATRGARVLVSIGDGPVSRALYTRPGWTIHEVGLAHSVRQEAGKRGKIAELLVDIPPSPPAKRRR